MREIHVKSILAGLIVMGVSGGVYFLLIDSIGKQSADAFSNFLLINFIALMSLFLLVSLTRKIKVGVLISSVLSFLFTISFGIVFTAYKINEDYANQSFTTDATFFNPLISTAIAMLSIATASYFYSKKMKTRKHVKA
jgi:uncharacterized membrane protein YjjB (DUF3815 family)